MPFIHLFSFLDWYAILLYLHHTASSIISPAIDDALPVAASEDWTPLCMSTRCGIYTPTLIEKAVRLQFNILLNIANKMVSI
jgi:hypothetical protein